MSPAAAAPCPFLDKIPAELRNEIYELTFASDHNVEEKVELFEARPPEKSILSTCRQIYEETRGYYIDAFRSYWQDTEFYVECEEPPKPRHDRYLDQEEEQEKSDDEDYPNAIDKVELVTFCARDVNQIRKISVCRDYHYRHGQHIFDRWVLRNGTWRSVTCPGAALAIQLATLRKEPQSFEAKGFYSNAYRSYWSTTNFVVTCFPARFSDIAAVHFSGEDVDHITKLQVVRTSDRIPLMKCTFEHGIWIITDMETLPGLSVPGLPVCMQLEHDTTRDDIIRTFTPTGSPKHSDEPVHKQLLLLMALFDRRAKGIGALLT
ncbi:uncharacterized protein MYCFIDRAFT_200413 [Pseudocercospora fijiensis CIRAD86]|uniref:Uncharacterized protein n=1 Tax=Pseudocercospora fijiensis (strain CIRAD86) TaxID=383855 RepID=M3A105_PSEFD|nr:uncharacterized protein MYCFIDRAFT_200413 [Pseudocercospora fijiensis CIRAD86]EME78081.1 hypothetical protein MYCFIDRAFT_200413 [Pseudocercospora fijiensis CIRAD86]